MRKIRSAGLLVLGIFVFFVLVGPKAEARERTHTVVKGDTLWDLAAYYYGDPWQWPAIADANPPPDVDDPHWIYPDQVLVIPGLEMSEVATEASAAITVPPAQVFVPASAPAPKKKKKRYLRPFEELSDEMPPGLTGQFPSLIREVFDKSWREDGRIALFNKGMERVVAAGDYVYARFPSKVTVLVSERFAVYRLAGRLQSEPDDGSVRVQRVGTVEAMKAEGGGNWKMLIIKSADTVQLNDMLKRTVGE